MNGELVGYYPHENNQVLVPLPFLPSQIPHRIAGVHFSASGGTRERHVQITFLAVHSKISSLSCAKHANSSTRYYSRDLLRPEWGNTK